MSPTVVAGLLLGVLCGLWTFVMGFTGWYKDPGKASASLVIIGIEAAVLLWGLNQTAMKEGRTYSGQVVAGTLISIIGGAVIVVFSLLFTTVFFPNYFSEMEPVYREVLRQQNKTETEIATAMAEWSAGQSSISQAIYQFLFTFVTGIGASAVLAIWVRARPRTLQASGSRV